MAAALCRWWRPAPALPGIRISRTVCGTTWLSVYRRVAQAFEAGHYRAFQPHDEITVVSPARKCPLAGRRNFDALPLLAQHFPIRRKILMRRVRIVPFDRVRENHPMLPFIFIERVEPASPVRRKVACVALIQIL